MADSPKAGSIGSDKNVIRVAHLLPTMEIGGRERIVADLCQTAHRAGVEPILMTYDLPKPTYRLIDTPSVCRIRLDRRNSDFRHQLQRALIDERIDVLHAQGHVSLALAAGATGGVPILGTLHMALGTGWRWLLPIVRGLRSADRLTAVSEDLARRCFRTSGKS